MQKFTFKTVKEQYGYWGSTELQTRDLTVKAETEEEARYIAIGKCSQHKSNRRLANGDGVRWRMA